MRTVKALSGTITRISALVIILLAFTTFSFAGDLFGDDLKVDSWMTTFFETVLVEVDETVMEADLTLEEWMITPFENSLAEADLVLENWMITPFDSSLEEEELTLELWMTIPFGTPAGLEMACCN